MTVKLEGYVTARDLAGLLRVSRSCVYSLVQRGLLPPGIKLGGNRRWPVRELKAYLESVLGGRECLTLLHQGGGTTE